MVMVRQDISSDPVDQDAALLQDFGEWTRLSWHELETELLGRQKAIFDKNKKTALGGAGGSGRKATKGAKTSGSASAAAQHLSKFEVLDKLEAGFFAEEKCQRKYEETQRKFEALIRQDEEQQWLAKTAQTGTMSDRIEALAAKVRLAPLFALPSLKTLVGLCQKKNRQEAGLAMETVQALFAHDDVLPDRSLRFFRSNLREEVGALFLPKSPQQAQAEQVIAKKTNRNKATPADDQQGAAPLEAEFYTTEDIASRLQLLLYFEDSLKVLYTSFLQSLILALSDNVSFAKKKAASVMAGLLVAKPEQEHLVLEKLVNKFGDTDAKISSLVNKLLSDVVQQQPDMKPVVAREVERFVRQMDVLHAGAGGSGSGAGVKSGQQMSAANSHLIRTKYCATLFLTEMMLDRRFDLSLSLQLINFYVHSLSSLVGIEAQRIGGAGDDAENARTGAAETSKGKGKKGAKGKGKGGKDHGGAKNAKNMMKPLSAHQLHLEQELDSNRERLIRCLLVGIKRAIPYLSPEVDWGVFDNITETLFRVCHAATAFATRVTLLSLLRKILLKRVQTLGDATEVLKNAEVERESTTTRKAGRGKNKNSEKQKQEKGAGAAEENREEDTGSAPSAQATTIALLRRYYRLVYEQLRHFALLHSTNQTEFRMLFRDIVVKDLSCSTTAVGEGFVVLAAAEKRETRFALFRRYLQLTVHVSQQTPPVSAVLLNKDLVGAEQGLQSTGASALAPTTPPTAKHEDAINEKKQDDEPQEQDYDQLKRDPRFACSTLTPSWELHSFAKHIDPTTQALAKESNAVQNQITSSSPLQSLTWASMEQVTQDRAFLEFLVLGRGAAATRGVPSKTLDQNAEEEEHNANAAKADEQRGPKSYLPHQRFLQRIRKENERRKTATKLAGAKASKGLVDDKDGLLGEPLDERRAPAANRASIDKEEDSEDEVDAFFDDYLEKQMPPDEDPDGEVDDSMSLGGEEDHDAEMSGADAASDEAGDGDDEEEVPSDDEELKKMMEKELIADAEADDDSDDEAEGDDDEGAEQAANAKAEDDDEAGDSGSDTDLEIDFSDDEENKKAKRKNKAAKNGKNAKSVKRRRREEYQLEKLDPELRERVTKARKLAASFAGSSFASAEDFEGLLDV